MSEVNENTELTDTEESIDDGIPEVSFTLEVYNTVPAPVDPDLETEGMAADAKATGDAIAAAQATLQAEIDALGGNVASIAGLFYPVGAVYVSTSDTAPTFGGENWNWEEIKIPVTNDDLIYGFRGYAAFESGDDPGEDHLHFWLRIADTEVS